MGRVHTILKANNENRGTSKHAPRKRATKKLVVENKKVEENEEAFKSAEKAYLTHRLRNARSHQASVWHD